MSPTPLSAMAEPAATGPPLGGGLLRDSGRTIVGTAATTVANFALIALIARALGNGAVGSYSVAFALRAVLVLVAGMGMRVALTRFVASLRARGDDAGARGAARLGVLVPTAVSVVLAGALAWAAEPLARDVFDSPQLAEPLRLVAISLPFAVLMDTCLAATQGFQSMRAYARIALVLEPTLRLALTGAVLVLGWGLDGCVLALALAGTTAGVAALLALVRDLRRLRPGVRTPTRDLFAFAGVSWVASLATQGLLWADVLILGVLVSDGEVGVYQVATRVLLAATLLVTPLTTAMAPRIAHAFEVGDLAGLTRRYNAVVLWSWRLTLPLLVGVLVVPQAALAAFGDDFGSGVDVIRVLACAAAVESLAAPSAVLLNQVGLNRFNMTLNIAALATNITLNILLVPRMGIVGAAIAWAVVMVVPGLVRLVAVRRLVTHQWPLGRPHAVALGAAVLSGAVADLVVRELPDVWALHLGVAALLVLTVYVVVVGALGLSGQERTAALDRGRVAKGLLLTRAPVLRRLRNRWRVRGLALGSARIPMDDLISPWRADILARVDLFRLIREDPAAPDEDWAAFLVAVSRTRYRLWFDHVLVDVLDLRHATTSVRERVFEQVVSRSVQLYRSVERRGFDRHHPVTVALVPAGVAVGGRVLGEDRWIPMDGCHRLALMIVQGKQHLESSEYVVDPLDVRRYHTERMARAERLDAAELVRFFGAGLADRSQVAGLQSWEDLLAALRDPANRASLEQWPEARWLSAASGPDWLEAHDLAQRGTVVGEPLPQPRG